MSYNDVTKKGICCIRTCQCNKMYSTPSSRERESSVMEIQSDRKYNQKDRVPWTLPEEEHVIDLHVHLSLVHLFTQAPVGTCRFFRCFLSALAFSSSFRIRFLYKDSPLFHLLFPLPLSCSIELITLPSNSSPFETGPGLAVPTSLLPNIFAEKLAVAFPALSRGSRFRVSVHLYGTKQTTSAVSRHATTRLVLCVVMGKTTRYTGLFVTRALGAKALASNLFLSNERHTRPACSLATCKTDDVVPHARNH